MKSDCGLYLQFNFRYTLLFGWELRFEKIITIYVINILCYSCLFDLSSFCLYEVVALYGGSVWWFGKAMWDEIMDAFWDDNGNGQWDLKFGHFLGFGFLNMWLEREGEWHLFGLVPCLVYLLAPFSLFHCWNWGKSSYFPKSHTALTS